jgi:hypothetical protein
MLSYSSKERELIRWSPTSSASGGTVIRSPLPCWSKLPRPGSALARARCPPRGLRGPVGQLEESWGGNSHDGRGMGGATSSCGT